MCGRGVLFLRVIQLARGGDDGVLARDHGVLRRRHRRETRGDSRAHDAGEEAIKRGLAKRVSQLQDEQERRAKAAAAENAAFSAEFLGAARRVFAMIDVDDSGTLTKEEIKRSVKSDKEVIDFLKDCGEENLQFLLEPKRLDRALNALDTSQDGEVDVDEWCVVRVPIAATANRSLHHAGRRRSSAA
jgi:hypothetical protein